MHKLKSLPVLAGLLLSGLALTGCSSTDGSSDEAPVAHKAPGALIDECIPGLSYKELDGGNAVQFVSEPAYKNALESCLLPRLGISEATIATGEVETDLVGDGYTMYVSRYSEITIERQ